MNKRKLKKLEDLLAEFPDYKVDERGNISHADWSFVIYTQIITFFGTEPDVTYLNSDEKWFEPKPKTKKVYLWAFKGLESWTPTNYYFETGEEGWIRLDYTMIEVPE